MNFSRSRCCGSVLVVGLLLVSMGCSKAPGDGQLSDQIRAKFKHDSGLQDKSITVQISGNAVTLSGDVGNDAERTAAGRGGRAERGRSASGSDSVSGRAEVTTD
jgi:osmotically-inducible protein OsmY